MSRVLVHSPALASCDETSTSSHPPREGQQRASSSSSSRSSCSRSLQPGALPCGDSVSLVEESGNHAQLQQPNITKPAATPQLGEMEEGFGSYPPPRPGATQASTTNGEWAVVHKVSAPLASVAAGSPAGLFERHGNALLLLLVLTLAVATAALGLAIGSLMQSHTVGGVMSNEGGLARNGATLSSPDAGALHNGSAGALHNGSAGATGPMPPPPPPSPGVPPLPSQPLLTARSVVTLADNGRAPSGKLIWDLDVPSGSTIVSRSLPAGEWRVVLRGHLGNAEYGFERIFAGFYLRATDAADPSSIVELRQHESLPLSQFGTPMSFGNSYLSPASSLVEELNFDLARPAKVEVRVQTRGENFKVAGLDAEWIAVGTTHQAQPPWAREIAELRAAVASLSARLASSGELKSWKPLVRGLSSGRPLSLQSSAYYQVNGNVVTATFSVWGTFGPDAAGSLTISLPLPGAYQPDAAAPGPWLGSRSPHRQHGQAGWLLFGGQPMSTAPVNTNKMRWMIAPDYAPSSELLLWDPASGLVAAMPGDFNLQGQITYLAQIDA